MPASAFGASTPPAKLVSSGHGNDELASLHEQFARSRDPRRREELVVSYDWLAHSLARRFTRRGERLEDLVQVARLGLLKAIDRFDPGRGTRFSTYAVPTIVGELKRHFRDHRWGMRVPRGLQEAYLEVRQANEELHQQLGRPPSVAEIAGCLRMDPERVLEALEARRAFRLVPLDTLPGNGGAPIPGQGENMFEAAEARQFLDPLVSRLPEREQRILRLWFRDEMTQSEIARQVGVSQMHVSRLLARSAETLRALAGPM